MYRRSLDVAAIAALALIVGIKIGEWRGPGRTHILKADLIQTHGIELTDDHGHVCGEFFVDKLGAPWLTLQDTRFPGMVSLTAGGLNNHARLVVTGGYRKSGAILSSDTNSTKLMMIAGEHRGAISWLDVNSDGSTNLDLHPGSGPNGSANLEVNGVPFNRSGRSIGK